MRDDDLVGWALLSVPFGVAEESWQLGPGWNVGERAVLACMWERLLQGAVRENGCGGVR